ncbi:MAG: lipase family protein, partial [Polyangiaceae bacterium]|nr:lipase family protein [Polyangiaceae bacterium]
MTVILRAATLWLGLALALLGTTGCAATSAASTAPMTAAVTLEQTPNGGKSFDFCLKPTSPVHLGNAAWLAFLSANEYAHGAVFAPMLNDLGFHNPNEPGDLTWPDCLGDLRQLREAEKTRSAELGKALGSEKLKTIARNLVPKDASWGSCARPFLEDPALRTDAFPAAAFQNQLVREIHPGSYLQLFSAGSIQSGGKAFRDASTQVLFARHRDLPITVLVFRGTEPSQMADIATDLKTWKTPLSERGWPAAWGSAHAGFVDAFESVEPVLMKKLTEIAERGDRIWITGHSLGGGLATLMAARLLRAREEGATFDVAGVYTFGSPRVGNKAFAAKFRDAVTKAGTNAVRVRNADDVVTSIPGLLLEYEHVGTLAYLTEGKLEISPANEPIY